MKKRENKIQEIKVATQFFLLGYEKAQVVGVTQEV